MRLRSIVKPALVVFLGLVLYLIASNVGAGWLYVIVAALAGIVLISAPLPWLGVRRVGITRRAPVVATAGEPFECTLEVENRGRLPRYMIEVEDRFAGDRGRAVAVRVRSGETETLGYTLENPRRGIYASGDIVVESRAPFGLFYGRRSTRAASDTVVYPRTFDVAGLPPSAVTDAEWGDRSEASTLHRGHGGEFWGVRDYRPGTRHAWSPGRRVPAACPRGSSPSSSWPRRRTPFRADDEPRRRCPARGQGDGRLGRRVAAPVRPRRRQGGQGRRWAGERALPEESTRDSILTWCAGLRASRPPAMGGASVEIRPSTKRPDTARETGPSGSPGASEVRAVVLVSCLEFAGPGPWMSQGEEQEFMQGVEARGRRVARLGAEVAEPWRI